MAGVFLTRDLTTIAILLSGGFFFLEIVIGPIWSVPMDIAPQYAGTASGLMKTGSAVAGLSPLAFGAIVERQDSVAGNVASFGVLSMTNEEQRLFEAETRMFVFKSTFRGELRRRFAANGRAARVALDAHEQSILREIKDLQPTPNIPDAVVLRTMEAPGAEMREVFQQVRTELSL